VLTALADGPAHASPPLLVFLFTPLSPELGVAIYCIIQVPALDAAQFTAVLNIACLRKALVATVGNVELLFNDSVFLVGFPSPSFI